MIIYIDEIKKICFLVSPKAGSSSIADYLNIPLHTKYSNIVIYNVLTDDNYMKIIIIRKNIIKRFMSGFYEDLFNSSCYDNINITFNDYLLFLNDCHTNKIKNVNNINGISIWYGDNEMLNITDKNGLFCSHIMSQHYALNVFINMIQGSNVKLIELNDLNKFLNYDKIMNKKDYNDIPNNMILSEMKKNKIMLSEESLTEDQKNIILNIYEIDINFIKELETKYIYKKY
jgi:hypothetical protein